MASIILGVVGAVVALGTMVYLSLRIQKPLYNFVTENVSDRAGAVVVAMTWIIIYYAGLKGAAAVLLSGVERGGGRLFWNVICDIIAAPATVIGNMFDVFQAKWLFLFAALMCCAGAVYRRISGGTRGRQPKA